MGSFVHSIRGNSEKEIATGKERGYVWSLLACWSMMVFLVSGLVAVFVALARRKGVGQKREMLSGLGSSYGSLLMMVIPGFSLLDIGAVCHRR